MMNEEDMKQALEHDEAMRQVAVNKEAAVASGQAIPLSPELDARVRRAQQLRIELGGFAGLAPEIRANPNVRAVVWPKVTEYVTLRLRLAADATFEALQVELGVSAPELRGMMQDVMTRPDAREAAGDVLAGLPATESPRVQPRGDLVAELRAHGEALAACTGAVKELTEAFSKTFADARH